MAKGYINIPQVEFEMAHLCLTYLAFDQFLPQLPSHQVKLALHNGDYAFADYASCYWATHLVEGVRDVSNNTMVDLRILTEAIDVFLGIQWASRLDPLTVSKTLQTQLAPIKHCSEYEKTCQAVVSTKNQLLPSGKGPLKEEVLYISKVMSNIRSEMESFAQALNITNAEKDNIEAFYGPNLFKCVRLNCRFYHEGFATDTQQRQHNDKHERAFLCAERGCPWETIGYATGKELRAHIKQCHEEPEYPEEDEEGPSARRKPTDTYQCDFCTKRFTKVYNLRSHLRTHTDERPFVCLLCGRAFARQHDRVRHQGLHSGEKKFVCRGKLKDKGFWGCGRRFPRPDALARHFKSEIGRCCVRPLLDEEAEENRQQQATLNGNDNATFNSAPRNLGDMMQTQPGYENFPPMTQAQPWFPAALLAQYPVLTTMDWNSMPLTGFDEDDEIYGGGSLDASNGEEH